MSSEPPICGFFEARPGRSWDSRGTSDAPDAGCWAWESLTEAVGVAEGALAAMGRYFFLYICRSRSRAVGAAAGRAIAARIVRSHTHNHCTCET